MPNKDFKVKNKLQVAGITSAGPVVSDATGNLDSTPYIATQYGGTGTVTSPNAGQLLYSSAGTTYVPTDLSSIVTPISYSANAPSSPVTGQIWVESDSSSDSFDSNIIRRHTFTATAAQTIFTTSVSFIDGYEQVYLNGTLLLRTTDYTTSGNNTVTLLEAAAVNDILEVITVTNLNSVNTYTQAEINAGYVSKSGGSTITASSASVIPIVAKGATSQSADLQQWQDSAGSVKALIGSGGNGVFNGLRSGSGSTTGAINAYTTAAQIGVLVRGAASQTANLQEWQNSAGTVLVSIGSNGFGLFGANVQVNGDLRAGASNLARITSISDSTTKIGLVVRGAASQTANLQEWQNSAGTILGAFNASGGLELNGKDVEIMNIMGAF